MSGWFDVPLSAEGLQAAARAADAIARTVRPDVLFTSPLRRAVQTANAVQQRWAVSVRVEPGLREIYCGELEGATLRRVQRDYAREWASNLRQADPDFRWPGGETYRQFRERAMAALAGIARASEGRRALVVTHAGVISQLMGVIHGLSAAHWAQYRPRNCTLTRVEWAHHTPILLAFDVPLECER
jgi:broad specificity phosphatase PhoE